MTKDTTTNEGLGKSTSEVKIVSCIKDKFVLGGGHKVNIDRDILNNNGFETKAFIDFGSD